MPFKFNIYASWPKFINNSEILAIHRFWGANQILLYNISEKRASLSFLLDFINIHYPSYSEAGELLFMGNRVNEGKIDFYDYHRLYKVMPNGIDYQLLIESRDQIDAPEWVPKSNQIIFEKINTQERVYWDDYDKLDPKLKNEGDGLYLLDINTGSYEYLIKDAYGVSYSPNGSHIAFCLNKYKNRSGEFIFIMNLKSKEIKFLTEGYVSQWSPDGKQICFTDRTEMDNGNVRIGIINNDGTERVMLTPEGEEAFFPFYSPDERFLAFSMNGDICIYDVRTEETRVIVPSDTGPLWVSDISKDSKYIAYYKESGNYNTNKSYIINLDTEEISDIGSIVIDNLWLRDIYNKIDKLEKEKTGNNFLEKIKNRLSEFSC